MTESNTGTATADRIRLGVSACLLGERVRYDGSHKRDNYLVGTLARYFQLTPLCPETAIGLGTPREPMRLVRDPDGVTRAMGIVHVEQDFTARLVEYAELAASELAGICGYVFKQASPSCGPAGVAVYAAGHAGPPRYDGRGVYARVLQERLPLLPAVDEGDLGVAALRENFIQRVFVCQRWQQQMAAGITAYGLVEFHTQHKLLIMAHSHAGLRRLGQLVAQADRRSVSSVAADYAVALTEVLRQPATPRGHTNVLQHLLRYLKGALGALDEHSVLDAIERYRIGELPRIVPLVLLQHFFTRYPDAYAARQCYLHPHPHELLLLAGG